jgi:hypothetical protein
MCKYFDYSPPRNAEQFILILYYFNMRSRFGFDGACDVIAVASAARHQSFLGKVANIANHIAPYGEAMPSST